MLYIFFQNILKNTIVPQIIRFINAIENPESKKNLANYFYNEIKNDPYKKIIFEINHIEEIFKFISDIIESNPKIVVIIDEINEKLKNELSPLYKNFDVDIIEFRTFMRENSKCLDDHVHLTESINKNSYSENLNNEKEKMKFKFKIREGMLKHHYLRIREEYREYFPKPGKKFLIETDVGVIETNVTKYYEVSKNLKKWFDAHPELKVGDYVIIEEIEPKKRYKMYIEKSGDKNESY